MPAMVSSDGSRRRLIGGGGGGGSADPDEAAAAAAAASPFLLASEPFLNLKDEASLENKLMAVAVQFRVAA